MLLPSSACAFIVAAAIAAPVGPARGSPPASAVQSPGSVELGPARAGSANVRTEAGTAVARVDLRPERTTVLNLAPGRYVIVDDAGATLGEATVQSGATVHAPLTTDVPPTATPPVTSAARGGAASDKVGKARQPENRGSGKNGGSAKRWASPLASALLPGLGQAINREPGKAAALFTAVLGGTLGAVGLWRLRNRDEGVSPDDSGPQRGGEVVRLGAFAALTSGVGLLYLGQIFDAHAIARGRYGKPREKHDFTVELSRFSTVALSPGEPSYALYDDWNLAVMGQVRPRLSVGISDLGLKFGPDQLTMQGGARVMGRVYDGTTARLRGRGPQRLWVLVGGGVFLQGTSRDRITRPLGANEKDAVRTTDRAFGAVGYAQAEARYFILDRWSLGLTPRVSLPFTNRAYPRERQLPRLATTFEIGASVGVHL